jgi:RNA polymerase sigma-70 factor (ECF subfamily)
MTVDFDRQLAEVRFREIFSHIGALAAYARRRNSSDADALAAEVMAIAWRRLADVPRDDPLPWLYATARNLLLAEARRGSRRTVLREAEEIVPAPEASGLLDPELEQALRSLGSWDREALLLVAWEDLTPSQAARALGLSPTTFRVRLLRARRRFRASLEATGAEVRNPVQLVHVDVEGTRT